MKNDFKSSFTKIDLEASEMLQLTWNFAWSRENDLSKDNISNIFSFEITEVG